MSKTWPRFFGAPPEGEILQAAYRFAYSLCSDSHNAEDLVQEASLKLCRKYGRIKSKALMFTTIRNLFYDQCRRNQRINFESLDEIGETTTLPTHESLTLSLVDLEDALDELEANERELIYLNKVEGYTAEDISQITNEPRGTVLWRLSEAMKKLRAFAAEKPAQQATSKTTQR